MEILETKLYSMIKELHNEIKAMRPADGFSSPRDIKLITEVNKKGAILNKLQEAMQIIIPDFDIKD